MRSIYLGLLVKPVVDLNKTKFKEAPTSPFLNINITFNIIQNRSYNIKSLTVSF